MQEIQISILSKQYGDVGHQTLYNTSNNTKINSEVISTHKENVFTCLSANKFSLIEENDNNKTCVMGNKNKNLMVNGECVKQGNTKGNVSKDLKTTGNLNKKSGINGDLIKVGETKGNVQKKYITEIKENDLVNGLNQKSKMMLKW